MNKETLLDLALNDDARAMTEETLSRIETFVPWLSGEAELREESLFHRQQTAVEALRSVGKIDLDEIKGIRWLSLSVPFDRPPWLTPEIYEQGRHGCLKRPMFEMMHMSIDLSLTWSGRLNRIYASRLALAFGEQRDADVLNHLNLDRDSLFDLCTDGVSRLLHLRPDPDGVKQGDRLRRLVVLSVFDTLKYIIGFSLAGREQEVEDLFVAVRMLKSGILLAQARGEHGAWCALMR